MGGDTVSNTAKKSRGGRPKKADKERLDFGVAFRLNATQKTRLIENATRAGMSPNEFAKACASTSRPTINRVIENRLAFEDRNALSRIGNNIYQIKRHLDQGLPVDQRQFDEAFSEFNAFMQNNIPR